MYYKYIFMFRLDGIELEAQLGQTFIGAMCGMYDKIDIL